MEPMAVIAYLSILALLLLAASKLLRLLAPILVALHGLLVAPVVRSLQQLGDRYFVRTALEPAPEPTDRPTDRSPHTNAAEPRSAGSANPAERQDLTVLDADALRLIQQIARHKLERPTDGKEATALAVSGARKGSSKAYQLFAQAWDLLYPPPAPAAPPRDLADDPEAWEAGPRPGQLVRRQRTVAR